MDFSWALVVLKCGARVHNLGWNGEGMYLELQRPDEHSKMGLPYIFLKTVSGELVPWTPSQLDLMSEQWEELEA